jgi:hypothetical protein
MSPNVYFVGFSIPAVCIESRLWEHYLLPERNQYNLIGQVVLQVSVYISSRE